MSRQRHQAAHLALWARLGQVSAPLLARWQLAQRAFDQRQPRERLLMVVVAVTLVLAVADALLIGPAFKALRASRSQLQQSLAQREALHTDALTLGNSASTQVQLRRAELSVWRQRAREGEALLRSHETSLVGPDQMLTLLDQVLARHGQVRVRAMRSLDRVDLLAQVPGPTPVADAGSNAALAPAGAPTTAPTTALTNALTNPPTSAPTTAAFSAAALAASPSAPPSPGTSLNNGASNTPGASSSLYRHGVELVLEGGFNDLLAYVQALEAMPQHLLWGGMSLKVQQHPVSLLTLRLYTVSRDRHWLEI